MKSLAIAACVFAIVLCVLKITKAINCNELCAKSGVPHIRGCFCRSQILSGKRSSERDEKTPEYNCSELCRLSSASRIGSCYCRPDMFQTKKSDSRFSYDEKNRDKHVYSIGGSSNDVQRELYKTKGEHNGFHPQRSLKELTEDVDLFFPPTVDQIYPAPEDHSFFDLDGPRLTEQESLFN